MPLYEYVCEQDGEVIELLRPAADADRPVDDPKAKGRVFKRRHSTFAAGAATARVESRGVPSGGCCPCGRNQGGCGGG